MPGKKKRIGLIPQVGIIFLVAMLLSGIFALFAQRQYSNERVVWQFEHSASELAQEMRYAFEEYPAYEWLLKYWYEHCDEMDIEYDSDYQSMTRTEQRCRLLQLHNPDFQFKYANQTVVEAMSAEDQKLYAEIVYSWLITRINQIKRTHSVVFLYICLSEEPYDKQFFMFSGADEGEQRGTEYGQVYTIGVVSDVPESISDGMREAVENDLSHLADTGTFVDFYSALTKMDGKDVLIGMTYSTKEIKDRVRVQTLKSMATALVELLLLAFICMLLLSRTILKPLNRISKNIRLYKQTKESEKIIRDLAGIKTRNEIGELAEDFGGLVSEMDHYTNEIAKVTAEKEKIETELTLANHIQASMLPNTFPAFPERMEFDIYANMNPAREVGGDFYDFFLIDETHLAMVIADVSGKGIPAALFMMASKIVIANNAMMGKSPAQILFDTNQAVCGNNSEEMFVTTWLGILDLETGIITASNAGHEYPAIKHRGGLFELLKDKHGFVIGGMSGMEYTEYEIRMEPGSTIFVYTDGLPEATNADMKMFGTERMIRALNTDPDAAPHHILSNMEKAVEDFVRDAEQFDDLTMLCLTYKPKKE